LSPPRQTLLTVNGAALSFLSCFFARPAAFPAVAPLALAPAAARAPVTHFELLRDPLLLKTHA